MDILDNAIKIAYENFRGLPNGKPIVRENITHDAFALVVFETLYGQEFNISLNTTTATQLSKFIVAPPDGGIDIVVEHEDSDEYSYDFIQVKNSELSVVDVQQCLSYMERTVADYLRNPTLVDSIRLKEILSETNFDKSYKSNCKYIVVHKGDLNFFKGQKNNESVINKSALIALRECLHNSNFRVPKEKFNSDSFNNFIIYDRIANPNEKAIMCNLCGYDLAKLANRYTNTSLGRNVLFGQNLRESLVKSSTYEGMRDTINKTPDKFWFFNNGITIIADDYDTINEGNNIESFVLENFSIINGAQTTSALGKFLKEAELNNDTEAIEKLKKVFVLARILKVKDDDFKSNIAIYNNTQNPITTRDMTSNRKEQNQLFQWLISGEAPNLYVEIRRGSKKPDNIRLLKHQETTNTELAQLAFAGFMQKPSLAKDKKSTLFTCDNQQEKYTINEFYHSIFNFNSEKPPLGILFQKKKGDIDELLFIQYLYKQSKRHLSNKYKKQIENLRTQIENSTREEDKQRYLDTIGKIELSNSINGICMFYCIALYYSYKAFFCNVDAGKVFDYEVFYSDSVFREKVITKFSQVFLSKTIEIIKASSATAGNINNWIRSAKSEQPFMDKLQDELSTNIDTLETMYTEFVDLAKK